MAEWYRVLRPFRGPNSKRQEAGQIVDGTSWRNAPKLVEQGRLLPTAAPQQAPKAAQESSPTPAQRKEARRA